MSIISEQPSYNDVSCAEVRAASVIDENYFIDSQSNIIHDLSQAESRLSDKKHSDA